ncbi:MAG TPA: sulfotransferase [Polyangiales bacterium]
MQDRLLFVISPPRAGSTLLQQMLGSHTQIYTHPEPHLITPLAYLGYHDTVDRAPYDHINGAEAIRAFVGRLPRGEDDYLDALRAYSDTMYGRMLEPSGRRYFLDKTPAYATALPFLSALYPRAKYIVLTRHPLAVMSSYANSFFLGDWHAANDFNPVLARYVPAMARLIREQKVPLLQVGYEALVRDPEPELARIFKFLELENEPQAVNYGKHFEAKEGMGDPIGVKKHDRPSTESVDKWVAELLASPKKRKFARELVEQLDEADLETWGYPKDRLFAALSNGRGATPPRPPLLNKYVFQRRVMLALKKNIATRPHGKVIKRIKYYCDVLLREQ